MMKGKGFESEAPKGVGKGKKPKPGDWYCPNCGDLNFARNVECRRCNTPKPEGMALAGLKPGDWECPNCGDINFAKNSACRKCNTPNPDPASSQAAMEAGIAAAASRFTEKPGDWYCPNCGFQNFARNLQCKKCGTQTADPETARAAAEMQKSKQEMKPGDWHCSSCGYLNFARNVQCGKCGTPNYQAMYMQMIGAGSSSSSGKDAGKGMKGKTALLMAQQEQQQLEAMNAMMMGGGEMMGGGDDWNAMAMAMMSQGQGMDQGMAASSSSANYAQARAMMGGKGGCGQYRTTPY